MTIKKYKILEGKVFEFVKTICTECGHDYFKVSANESNVCAVCVYNDPMLIHDTKEVIQKASDWNIYDENLCYLGQIANYFVPILGDEILNYGWREIVGVNPSSRIILTQTKCEGETG